MRYKQQVGVGHQDQSCKSGQSHDPKSLEMLFGLFPPQYAFAFLFCLDLLLIPSIKTLSCSIFVLVCDSVYRLSGFYRRQPGANHYGQLKCSSALACDSTVLPVCRPTSGACGRLQHQAQSDWWAYDPVSKCVPVVVSAWWRRDKEELAVRVQGRGTAEATVVSSAILYYYFFFFSCQGVSEDLPSAALRKLRI